MTSTRAEKIKALEKELSTYKKVDYKKSQIAQEKAKIRDLKEKIKSKKYAGLRRVGRNLKHIGGAVGKQLTKISSSGQKTQSQVNIKPQRSIQDVINSMPQ